MRWWKWFWIITTRSDICNRPVINDCVIFCNHCLNCLEINRSPSKLFLDGSFHNSNKQEHQPPYHGALCGINCHFVPLSVNAAWMVGELHRRSICVAAVWNVVASSEMVWHGNDNLLTKCLKPMRSVVRLFSFDGVYSRQTFILRLPADALQLQSYTILMGVVVVSFFTPWWGI